MTEPAPPDRDALRYRLHGVEAVVHGGTVTLDVNPEAPEGTP